MPARATDVVGAEECLRLPGARLLCCNSIQAATCLFTNQVGLAPVSNRVVTVGRCDDDVGQCDDDGDALPPGTADDDDELVGDIREWMLASGQRRPRRVSDAHVVLVQRRKLLLIAS